jgi:peptide/nickel transport system substrate-binding protein
MKRRHLLGLATAASAALAAPRILAAQNTRVMRFIPSSELNSIDPVWIPSGNVRTHGYMVFDTLYGIDASYRAVPQMVEGAVIEDDGRRWRLTLRSGLMFHDGTRVLARDCTASINRWSKRDPFGQALMAATDAISAPDDTTIEFRLKRPFALLPDALASTPYFMPAMMPERLARTDPFTQITEMVGSGPYRYKADERVSGARVVYERFEGYKPREGGVPEWTAGPKVAYFDRVEWTVIPDAATAASALISGEADRLEYANLDLLGLLRTARNVRVEIADPTGMPTDIRMNQAIPPFDNAGIRRALLGAVRQEDYVTAMAGTDSAMWKTGLGIFTIGSPMASDAGMDVLMGPRDIARVRDQIKAAGYGGEKVVLLVPADVPTAKAASDVCAEMLKSVGMNVDYQAMDWGTVAQRRMKKDPADHGGWNIWIMPGQGLSQFNPVVNGLLRTGPQAYFGWPTGPRLEALRDAWLAAPNLVTQQAICRDMQVQAFIDVPFIPVGQFFQPTAYAASIRNVSPGFATFWNIRRS